MVRRMRAHTRRWGDTMELHDASVDALAWRHRLAATCVASMVLACHKAVADAAAATRVALLEG